MTKQKRTKNRVIGLVSLSIIFAAATFGFAEVNTTLSAGYGVKSSYQVSKINYFLDVEDPTSIAAVEFMVEQDATEVYAGVSVTENGQIVWADGCEQTNSKWTCTFAEKISVLEADWLHIK